jgi:uncharacterized membrane protein (TIGR02234 family)
VSPARALALTATALLAAAGALAGSSALTWYAAEVPAPGRAAVRVAARGGDLLAGLDAVALFALAAVAAIVALAGPARRVLGAAVGLVAAWLAAALVAVLARSPTPAESAGWPGAPAGAGLPAEVTATAAPLLAAAGVLLLAATGAAIVWREPRLARLGARYAAAGSQPDGRSRERDPDRDAWDALDAGRDPTDT